MEPKKERKPLWEGPQGKGPNGGITFSSLSRFLSCPERFRIYAIEGLRPQELFNHRIEYGNMWHVCEESAAQAFQWIGKGCPEGYCPCPLETALSNYVKGLIRKYPLQQQDVDKWYNVCKVQFPEYLNFWSKHPDVVERTPLLQEQEFKIPYTLPSGVVVYLRGKWDSVDLVGNGKSRRIFLQENKTKGEIDEGKISRQLTFDFQTMLYMVALRQDTGIEELEKIKGWNGKRFTTPIVGVRYNVVRRPLSGGKGTIVQKKGSKNIAPESKQEYYSRLADYIKEEPETYFKRWEVNISSADLQQFCVQTLNPTIERLVVWYNWVVNCYNNNVSPFKNEEGQNIHWRHPFGCVNYIDDDGNSDVDNYLLTGSTVGLKRIDRMFRELVS